MAQAIIRHFGICVADIEHSARFYIGALGFEPLMPVTEIGAPFDVLVEQPGKTLNVRQLCCGEVTIELLAFADGDVTGTAERGPMNRRGLTHITLVVDDIDATVARICEYGGAVVAESRIASPFGPLLFCTDPDGVRLELMQGKAAG